jgi:gluconate 2-dehydrogenase gamma chain
MGLAALVAGAGLAGCNVAPKTEGITPTPVPITEQYPEVPSPPAEPLTDMLISFTPQEAQVLEALTARILPGTPDDPGAREAGVTNFVDKMLAFNNGIVEPTYTHPPFAKTYEGDNPPPEAQTADPTKAVWVKKDELERYGHQSSLTPKEAYRAGLSAVDRYAGEKFGKKFAELSEDQQDQIISDMADDKVTGFDKPSARDFFKMLRDHTIQGMFADPAYGGNHGMVGWKLIGYPGAQRAYTPADMKTEGNVRPPQSLAMLHHFHPGQPSNPNVILPVSGSDEQRPEQQQQMNMNP